MVVCDVVTSRGTTHTALLPFGSNERSGCCTSSGRKGSLNGAHADTAAVMTASVPQSYSIAHL
eukprot:2985372-Rhodomonas_salina.2